MLCSSVHDAVDAHPGGTAMTIRTSRSVNLARAITFVLIALGFLLTLI